MCTSQNKKLLFSIKTTHLNWQGGPGTQKEIDRLRWNVQSTCANKIEQVKNRHHKAHYQNATRKQQSLWNYLGSTKIYNSIIF